MCSDSLVWLVLSPPLSPFVLLSWLLVTGLPRTESDTADSGVGQLLGDSACPLGLAWRGGGATHAPSHLVSKRA